MNEVKKLLIYIGYKQKHFNPYEYYFKHSMYPDILSSVKFFSGDKIIIQIYYSDKNHISQYNSPNDYEILDFENIPENIQLCLNYLKETFKFLLRKKKLNPLIYES